MKILIETIPHKEQRYNTCGDWFYEGTTLHIKVSALSDWRREFLVAFHELFEAMWCKHARVSQEDVDQFDLTWQSEGENATEPGDDPTAPYYRGHQMAIAHERLACFALDQNWFDYERELELLLGPKEKNDD